MKATNLIIASMSCGAILFLCGAVLYTSAHKEEASSEASSYENTSLYEEVSFYEANSPLLENAPDMDNTYHLVQEKSYSTGEISHFDIDFSRNSHDVYFYESEESEFIIREYLNFTPEEDDISTLTVKSNCLTMKGKEYDTSSFLFHDNDRHGYVEIYYPEMALDILEVETASGDISSERDSMLFSEFTLTSTSGDIQFPVVNGHYLQIDTTSGDITMGETYCPEINASSTSGDIHFDTVVTDHAWSAHDPENLREVKGNLTVATTSGDVTILRGACNYEICTTSGDVELEQMNGAFQLETTSGNISADNEIGHGEANSISGNIEIALTKLFGDLTMETTSGTVNLKLPEDASFEFEYDSTSGECSTFFDDILEYDDNGHSAKGVYGANDDFEVSVSTISGDLNVKTNYIHTY